MLLEFLMEKMLMNGPVYHSLIYLLFCGSFFSCFFNFILFNFYFVSGKNFNNAKGGTFGVVWCEIQR